MAFGIGLVVLLFLAIKLRISAFVALLVGAVTIGLLSGMEGVAVVKGITEGFGKTLSSIGIIIIFGVMLGKYLEDSGGARRLAVDCVRMLGQKKSPFAMSIAGYLISIPVFSDVGYVILSPLAKAISNKSGVAFSALAVSLAVGLLATHVYVPPTPGPLAVAGLLKIDIGRAIAYGSFAAIFMTLFGWAWAMFYVARKHPEAYQYHATSTDTPADVTSEKDMPGTMPSLFPLLFPMVLILLNTTSSMLLGKKHPVAQIFAFIGDANVALALGTVLAIVMLGKRIGKEKVLKIMDAALTESGQIIFITAAGGSLGAILKISGAGNAVADYVAQSGLPFILIPFVISGLLKAIQGSGTVAVITVATLCAPMAAQLNMDPILIFLATGAGARLICHVNDSFFWVFTKMNEYDMNMGLKTLSISGLPMALGGLFATWLAQMFML
jgi:GntP family gluconate:H+ symporter